MNMEKLIPSLSLDQRAWIIFQREGILFWEGIIIIGCIHFPCLKINKNPTLDDLKKLLNFGGFPEPFLRQSKTYSKRWVKERRQRVINEDLRDLKQVKEISLIYLLVESLPDRVGSPLSIRSLREDLGVSHQTVENWISLLENLYMVFRISPYGAKKIRAVKKEQKLYFFDWSSIRDESIRFENLVACSLLKYCHYYEDVKGGGYGVKIH